MILAGVLSLILIMSIIKDLKRIEKENCYIRPFIYNKFLLLSMLIIAMMLNYIITHWWECLFPSMG